MSEEKKELNILDQLKSDLEKFIQQKDVVQNNLHQIIGAIFATEQAMQKIISHETNSDQENKNNEQSD